MKKESKTKLANKKVEKKESTVLEKIDKKKIIIIGSIIILIILIIIIFAILGNKNKIDNSIVINVGGYNQKFKVKSIQKNIDVKDDKYGGKYTKIFVEIDNLKDVDSITALHQFQLLDSKDNELSYCYHAGLLPDSSVKDALSNTLTAKSKTSGYLYCPTESLDGSKLKITVISGGKINEDGMIDYEYEYYYVDFK